MFFLSLNGFQDRHRDTFLKSATIVNKPHSNHGVVATVFRTPGEIIPKIFRLTKQHSSEEITGPHDDKNRHRYTFLKSATIVNKSHSNHMLPAPRNKSSNGFGAMVFIIPEEIIAKIFRLAQQRSSKERTGPHSDWCWISVTHVCKRWRSIALDTQDLWTYIDATKLSGIEQTEVYLERSGTSELVVIYNANQSITDECISLQCFFLTLTHIHCIRELQIYYIRQGIHRLRTTLYHNPAPALQIFLLYTGTTEVFDLRALFHGHAPKLTEMCLGLRFSPWVYAPFMAYITRMCFTGLNRETLLTVQEAIAILSGCRAIEKLRINCLKNIDQRTESRSLLTSIQLPNLKSIEVTNGNHATISLLLKSIVSQNILSWRITCWDYPIRGAPKVDPKSVIPYVSSHNSKICRSLKLGILSYTATIKCNSPWEMGPTVWETGSEDFPHRSMDYRWHGFGGLTKIPVTKCFEFVSSVIEGDFWCSAIELEVRINEWSSDEPNIRDLIDIIASENHGHLLWKKLLHMLPHLQILSVDRQAYYPIEAVENAAHRGLFRALKSTFTGEDGNTQLICPCLSELRLCGMKLDIVVSDLVEALVFRASCGKQLNRLEISKTPGLMEEDLLLMKRSGIAREIDIVY